MTTIAISGHRSEKIEEPGRVREVLRIGLALARPNAVIVGMANGVDIWAGLEALDLGFAVVAAKPWSGHKPRVADVADYERIIQEAIQVTETNPSIKYPGPWAYQVRNKWMVDHADKLFAIWDGSPGGTCNCINYARATQTPVKCYNPVTEQWTLYAK